MDFAPYDKRRCRTIRAAEGYADWVETYEDTVSDEMDLRLLERLECVAWPAIGRPLSLVCVWRSDGG